MQSVESVDLSPLYPVIITAKKPYNKEVIDAIEAKIDERTKYLLQTSPDVSMKIDIILSNLYFELNSYNLNQSRSQAQTESQSQQP